MNIYRNIKKQLAAVTLALLLFSPFSFAFADESTQTLLTQNQQTDTPSLSPQLARGVDSTKLGPQQTTVTVPQNETVVPTTPVENTLIDQGALASTTTPPSAPDTFTGQNDSSPLTANDVKNDPDKSSENNKTIDSAQNANVTNEMRGVIGTGGNIVEGTRGNVEISTGDADSVLSIINMINSIFAGVDGGKIQFFFKNVDGNLGGNYVIDPSTGALTDVAGAPVIINDNTGQNSKNLVSNDNISLTTNRNTSLSNLINRINLNTNTGNNRIDNVVGDNTIKTGNANISLNVLNFLNSTFVVGDFGVVGVLNILGDWTGDLLLPKSIFGGFTTPNTTALNSGTGTNSVNQASEDKNVSNDSSVTNSGQIKNSINLAGNTGGNVIDSKVGDSNIITGTVNLILNANNFANITVIGDVIYMAFVNVLGRWFGSDLIGNIFGLDRAVADAAISNQNTGVNSANTANVIASDPTTSKTDNQATLENLVKITANTGDNQISSGRGDATIQTGNVSVLSNIVNFLNSHFVGKRLVMLFVNVFGNWYGNIDFKKETIVSRSTVAPTNQALTINQKVVNAEQKIQMIRLTPGNTSSKYESTSLVINDPQTNDPRAYQAFFLPTEKSNSGLATFLADHLNILVFALFICYLSFLLVYLKVRKSKI